MSKLTLRAKGSPTSDYEIAKFAALRNEANQRTAEYTQARFEHCRDRLRERFGLTLTRREWDEINLRIFLETDGVDFLDRGDSEVSGLYVVEHRGVRFLTCYSETNYIMLTVLPRADARLIAHLRGTFIPKPNGADSHQRSRAEKLALVGPFSEAHLDSSGALHMVWPEPANDPEPAPASGNVSPFAALASLKPVLEAAQTAPIVTPAAPQPAPAPKPQPVASGDDVMASFASTERKINSILDEMDEQHRTVADHAAALEAKLASLRSGEASYQLRRQIIAGTRLTTSEAMSRYVSGALDPAAARSFLGFVESQLGSEVEDAQRLEAPSPSQIHDHGAPSDLPGEVWRPIPSYEGLYELSNMKRVRSLPRSIAFKGGSTRMTNIRILRGNLTGRNRGIRNVGLSKDGTLVSFAVATLMRKVWPELMAAA